MLGESATGSAYLGLLGQCKGELKAIEAAADVVSVVAAMRGREGSVRVQETVCRALIKLTFEDAENKTRAGAAGAVEAVATAMCAHAGSAGVQEAACCALRNLTSNNDENTTRAGTAGAVEAVAAAMRVHAENVGVQEAACSALTNLGINEQNDIRAGATGAIESVVAAMRTHAGSAGVQEAACWGAKEPDQQQRRERNPSGGRGRHRVCGGSDARARRVRWRAGGGV